MSRRSPRVTRRQTRSHHNESDDDDTDNSPNHSNISSRSWRNDSPYSFHSVQRSRNDSSSYEADRAASVSSYLSNSPSPNKSNRSFSPSGMYPNLSDELNESGDSSFTRITDRKEKKLYPDLQYLSDKKSRHGKESRESSSSIDHETTRSSPRYRKTEGSTERGSGCNGIMCIFIVIAIVVSVVLYLVTANSPTNSLSNTTKSGYELFVDEIKTLKGSFPSQTTRFWMTVSASARHVFEQQDPCYPSVILMASHSKNQQLNMCLAKKIASSFSSSFGVNSHISTDGTDVEDFKYMDADQQKWHLDKIMQKAFLQEGKKAFVISNVHSLSPRASLLLHGFCDGDNAPFKDVMIILTFQVDDGVAFKSVKEVEVHLTDIWSKGLDMDKLSALMSRVANNPVVLMSEEESIVKKLCL